MERHSWDEAAEGDGTGKPGTTGWTASGGRGLTPPDPDYADKTLWSINEANALPHPEKDELCRKVLKQIRDQRDAQGRFRKRKNIVTWDQRLEELKAYKAQHGHMKVTKSEKKETSNAALASWVDKQRKQWRSRNRGEKTHITQERIDQLDEIGFVWDTQQAVWDTHYERLKTYKTDNGDCRVPRNYAKALGATWVEVQRAFRRRCLTKATKTQR